MLEWYGHVFYQVTLTLWHQKSPTVHTPCDGKTTKYPMKMSHKNMQNRQPFKSQVFFCRVHWALKFNNKALSMLVRRAECCHLHNLVLQERKFSPVHSMTYCSSARESYFNTLRASPILHSLLVAPAKAPHK